MTRSKFMDTAGLAGVAAAVAYGAMVSSADALVLGGLVVAVYACVLFAPGLGGRAGAAILLSLMGLFALVFAVHVKEPLACMIVAGGAVRAGMLVLAYERKMSHTMSAS